MKPIPSQHKLFALIVPSLILLVLFIPGIMQLTPNSDPRVFFDKNNVEYQAVLDLEQEFTQNNSVIFVFESISGQVFEERILRDIDRLSTILWTKSHVQRVDSLTNFQRTQNIDDTLETSALYDPQANNDLKEIRQYSRHEPRLMNSILGSNLDVTAVVATLDVDRAVQTQVAEVTRWATDLADEFNQSNTDYKIHLAGSVIYSNALSDATKIEFQTKLPIVLGLMILILYTILRNAWLVVAILYAITMTNIVTLGIAGWAGIPLTPIIAFVPISLIAIVLADAVHLITSYLHSIDDNLTRDDAIKQSLRTNFKPMLITSLTTAIGFLCLNISDSPPYQHLGNITAAGSIIAFIFTVYWLPHWVTLAPATSRKALFADFSILNYLQRPKSSIFVVLVGLVLLGSQLPNNYLDERMDRFFDETWQIKRTNDLVNEKLTGVHRLEYRVPSSAGLTITSERYLQALSEFTDWASAQPHVAHITGFDQIIKTINQQMHEGFDHFYKVPGNDELNSQYFLLYEMSLPYGATLEDIVNFEKSATRLRIMLHSTSSSEILQFRNNANRWIKSNWPEEMITPAISLEAAFSDLNRQNSQSLIQGTLLGFGLIAIMLCITLKSIKLGLISIVSNTLPALAGFGVWGMVDGQVGLAVSIVTVITLGVVVDDTIHMLTKYQTAMSDFKYTSKQAAIYALHTTGKALFTTTMVLFICFGVLSFSHFKPNADLGFLSATTLAIALIIDVFLLLPLIMFIDRDKNRESYQENNQAHADVTP